MRELCNLSEVQVKKQERKSERVELENGREEEPPRRGQVRECYRTNRWNNVHGLRGGGAGAGPEVLLVNTITVY